ncbi:MAG: BON domain-containing protein [Pseudomonadota bacterium]|nr:BON domain-containing protein [Pseudomonadota bacterium]MDE3036847.1 BON domain-containing protein [Pseudomonadota bacterium]
MMRISGIIFALGAAVLLSGCVPLLIGGGTEAAVVVAQERSVGNALDDAGILVKIKDLYAQHDYKDLLANVDVKVVEGRVLLAGNVDTPEAQIEAVRLAWQALGVKEVMNNVQVNDKSGFWNYARDVWISTQIRTKLVLTRDIRSINYSVITVNQVVYLMGIAQNQDELNRVTYVTGTTPYVQRVVSYVVLKDDPRRGYTPQ